MDEFMGYMSDVELENKLREFLNHQPGKDFMKYLFKVQTVSKLYDEYAIAVEDENDELEKSLKEDILLQIRTFYYKD